MINQKESKQVRMGSSNCCQRKQKDITIEETISYIIEKIYIHKKLTPICSKLIFRRLLIKLATECTFKFSSRFFKQVDGCTMRGPLPVTFSDIYMVKVENDVVTPSKPIFYCRFVDGIYSRRKLRYKHSNIRLSIEVNPSTFLDTKLTNISGVYKLNVFRKNTKLTSPWTSKTSKRYKQNTSLMVILIVQK